MRITSLISPCLPHSGLFGPSLGLNFLKGVDFSYLYHLFVLVLPLPFMIGKIKSKRLGGWGEGGGSLVWAAFPSAFPPGGDSSGSWKVDLGLR